MLTAPNFAESCRAPQWMAGEGEVWPQSEFDLPACSVARMVFYETIRRRVPKFGPAITANPV